MVLFKKSNLAPILIWFTVASAQKTNDTSQAPSDSFQTPPDVSVTPRPVTTTTTKPTTTQEPYNDCGSKKEQRGSSGSIQSLNYPGQYLKNVKCEWNVEVDWPSKIVVIPESDNFSIGYSDSLVLSDETNVQKEYRGF